MTKCRGSLLAVLANEKEIPKCDFIWMYPGLHSFPGYLQEQVKHAQYFSEVMHGAALLYNLMLAEKSVKDDLVEEYSEWLHKWKEFIKDRLAGYGVLDAFEPAHNYDAEMKGRVARYWCDAGLADVIGDICLGLSPNRVYGFFCRQTVLIRFRGKIPLFFY